MATFSKMVSAEAGSYEDTTWEGTFAGEHVRFFSRPLTSSDMTKISRAHPNFGASPTFEGMVDLLILKVRDEHGEKGFDRSDKPVLMRVSTEKVGEIFAALFGSQFDDDSDEAHEERVKNSGAKDSA